ncbi:hypothetical protein M438DRAFT_268779 [Aureobasidium pullulans EXF-150]|uniref:Uncharacterized protein n=1 Tax=Aureobasidium pullulans EXF-150 TaxID=1043002 RepID=A0A074XNI2_AURPU|nr:uncharacterized protein M438DRAFT_268779 [Aureobasidium pullulans EXF-150]KEQ87088.1 hypothetical protein M438DRAFT_268779 [Aureobasidium pullulans EXF-150]
MAIGQTVTVVNKSGKVVSTGKHVVNVFKEAKSAYRERKAEIKAVRDAEIEQKRVQKTLEKFTLEDDHASQSSRRSHKSSKDKRSHRDRPLVERGYSDSFYANDRMQNPRSHQQSASEADVDMDLAYGELPPPLPERPHGNEIELREKMTKLQQLLDEANCVQHSVIATIENLQKNPDALAAVALTLGEISTMAGKMAPGVLTSMKTAFPAIIALLASPQFMIAAGVGVGVTVIAFGGYKIIKKIQKHKEEAAELKANNQRQIEDTESVSEYDELYEIDSDLSHIEVWRRGIADAEAQSLGTSVDGEFLTPDAGRQLVADGVLREGDLKSMRSGKSHKTSKSKKSKKESKSEKLSSTSSSKDKEKRKKKEPSGLRMLFKTRA